MIERRIKEVLRSFPYLQEHANGPYYENVESSPHPHIKSVLILSSHKSCVSQMGSCLHVYRLRFCMNF
jgi:hypothetical protein